MIQNIHCNMNPQNANTNQRAVRNKIGGEKHSCIIDASTAYSKALGHSPLPQASGTF